MCWPYVRKRSALPAHHSLRISAGVYRRRHTNMAYYIYKRGRKGGVPSSVADGRHTRDRGCPSYFFVVFSSPFSFPRLIFFLFFFFYLCAAVPTGHVFYNGEHRTSKQQCPSIQAWKRHSLSLLLYMPNIRALSWPLKCYLTGRFDWARRGLE